MSWSAAGSTSILVGCQVRNAVTARFRAARAYRVVVAILDEIQTTGDVPSQRAVGAKLGLSHPAVGKALKRFETYLTDDAREHTT